MPGGQRWGYDGPVLYVPEVKQYWDSEERKYIDLQTGEYFDLEEGPMSSEKKQDIEKAQTKSTLSNVFTHKASRVSTNDIEDDKTYQALKELREKFKKEAAAGRSSRFPFFSRLFSPK
jgi:hypothetical protein